MNPEKHDCAAFGIIGHRGTLHVEWLCIRCGATISQARNQQQALAGTTRPIVEVL